MSDWNFLGRYAITTYPNNPHCEYVVVKKLVVGYVEKNQDNSWSYYEFGQQQKGVATAPEAVLKSTGSTAEDAVEKARR